MSRKRLNEPMTTLIIRLSEKDKAFIKEQAEDMGFLSISNYVRYILKIEKDKR